MTGPPAGPPGELLVVTTRSRLRAARHFPDVLRASLRVRRQLAGTEGLIRGASMIAGPTEFWTITIWRSRHAMQQFNRDGAHGLVMWDYPRWLSSLWLMRWRPRTEVGSWDGIRIGTAPPGADAAPATDVSAAESLPELLAAMGPAGAPTFESSPVARRGRRQVRGVHGALVRLHVPLWQVPGAVHGLRRLLADGALVRGVVGIGRPGEVYCLGVGSDAAAVERVLAHPWLERAASRRPDRFWSLSLAASGEFGTWDGRRLRRGPRARRE